MDGETVNGTFEEWGEIKIKYWKGDWNHRKRKCRRRKYKKEKYEGKYAKATNNYEIKITYERSRSTKHIKGVGNIEINTLRELDN